MSKRTSRRRIFRAGLAITFVGAVLGLTGIVATPAGAAPPGTSKVTICHRTNAPTNPYRVITISVRAADGLFVGPDHTGHPGPVFDFSADPQDPDYPYTTPRNGDQWGDIIPPYEFDGGSFPGMNWEDGEAIHAADCQGPEEPPDPTCPDGQVWDDANDNGEIDDGECVTPIECPAGTTWLDANQNGIEEEGECAEPEEEFVCPADTTWDDANGDGIQTEDECTEVLGEVITPPAPAQLPRTGTGTVPLTLAGAGLILVGAGTVILARERMASS